MPKRKSKPVEIEDDSPCEPIADYPHGSLARGDRPPPWVARAIEDVLRGNPYRDLPQDDLDTLAWLLKECEEQLRLVEQVMQARHSVW